MVNLIFTMHFKVSIQNSNFDHITLKTKCTLFQTNFFENLKKNLREI